MPPSPADKSAVPFRLHNLVTTVEPGTVMIREGTTPGAVRLLMRGRIRVLRGKTLCYWLTEPYVPFGLEAVTRHPSPVSYVTAPDSKAEVAVVPTERLPDLFREYPDLGGKILAGCDTRELEWYRLFSTVVAEQELLRRDWKLLARMIEDLSARDHSADLKTLTEWMRHHPANEGDRIKPIPAVLDTLPGAVRDLLIRLASTPTRDVGPDGVSDADDIMSRTR